MDWNLLLNVVLAAYAVGMFCSCAMRMYRVVHIWRTFHPPTERQSAEAKKLFALALTNLFMFSAFALGFVGLNNPEWAAFIRPYRISSWALGLPTLYYSVLSKYFEIQDHEDHGD